jgi:hypothetical protein
MLERALAEEARMHAQLFSSEETRRRIAEAYPSRGGRESEE